MTFPEFLAQVKKRVSEATPGPWCEDSIYIALEESEQTKGENNKKDSQLIANAPTDLTTLIQACEKLVDALEQSGHGFRCPANEGRICDCYQRTIDELDQLKLQLAEVRGANEEALWFIDQMICHCSPEVAIDPEERKCLGCRARQALKKAGVE